MTQQFDKVLSHYTNKSNLGPILDKITQLKYLNQQLRTLLDPELINYCSIINFSTEQLVLGTTSSLWLNRLRFLETSLLAHFRPQMAGLVSVRWKIIPEKPAQTAPSLSLPMLSLAARELLQATAEQIKHPRLQQALYQLADNNKS